jgi:hypothetical protein
VMRSEVLTISDTLDIQPFPGEEQGALGQGNASSSFQDDAIRARLADVDRQEEKSRRLQAFLDRETPAWDPADHPELDGPLELDKRLAENRDFFVGKSLSELAREQGVGPVKDISVFAGGIPDDEDVDELLAQLEEMDGL